ncbi:PREDICTED: beta-defensin 112, partial [Chrysochloris asiatica]|uniref:Beta-defensin 112 n=1 Tax=Chrysochloris asiatica TaxID=185453 RepID=A0A9B0TBD2_CHRAS
TTMCVWEFEKLFSKTHNSSTVFEENKYEIQRKNTLFKEECFLEMNEDARRVEHCDGNQKRIANCERNTVNCCLKRCKPVETEVIIPQREDPS